MEADNTPAASRNNAPKLSIVLPAYLEEENLRLLLPRVQHVVRELGLETEILVIDTVKPLDNTEDACNVNDARYIRRAGGNTYGDAIRTGIACARAEYILFMDADGSHSPEFIGELWRFAKQYDVVIASRYIDGGYSENSAGLLWMSRVLNGTYSFVLNLKCKDVSNSFKIYRAEPLRAIRLRCNNFDIVEEILFKLSRSNKNFQIKEVPFTFKKRMFGNTKRNLFSFILTYLYTIVRLRLRLR